MSFKARLVGLFSLLGVLTVMSACQHAGQSPLQDAATPRRVHATYVSFTKWTDTMQIDTAVAAVGGTCQIMEPLISDASTNWRPFQIYWAIRDDQDDVTMTTVSNAFFAGDLVTTSNFPGVLGFAHLNTQFAGMLELKSMTVSPDRSSVQASIGSPFDAVIQLQTVLEGDACVTHASYCRTAGDCSTAAAFKPLVSVHVTQNWLGYPTDVTFN